MRIEIRRHDGQRAGGKLRVRVEKENVFAPPFFDTPVVACPKPEVLREHYQFDPGKLAPNHFDRIVCARIVDNDCVDIEDFTMHTGYRFKAFAQEPAGIEIYNDNIDTHESPHSSENGRAVLCQGVWVVSIWIL